MNAISTLGGLAGAVALTLLNEGVKKIDNNAPRLDLLGQNALAKLLKGNTMLPQTVNKVFPMAGDLVTNSLFFAMAQGSGKGDTYLRGALLGLSAGIGAVALPKQLGLEEKHTNENPQKALKTVAWYVIGGLIAAAVMNAISEDKTLPQLNDVKDDVRGVAKTAEKKVREAV
jgi:hypothetical protein